MISKDKQYMTKTRMAYVIDKENAIMVLCSNNLLSYRQLTLNEDYNNMYKAAKVGSSDIINRLLHLTKRECPSGLKQ